ncbi:MAG: FecR family protein [Hyphomicrobium sp.]
MRLRLLALIGTTLFWSGMPAVAAPGEDIGAAVRIVNLVTAEYETDHRRLATGDNVRQDELIEVSSDGTGEIRLRDNTQLALGPGSQLLLDEFVYKPDVSGGAIVLNLVKGSFRFITGIAVKPAYVIRTPTASITVRGTIFDVYVQSSGMSWLLLIEGAIEVCNARDDCRLHDEPGKLIRITPEGDVGNPVRWVGLPKTDVGPFESAFPFVVTPPQFDPDPIFTPDDIVGGTSPDAGDKGDGPKGDGLEEANEDPPSSSPQLRCWAGWKKVPIGWSATGWRVEKRWRANSVVYCAKRVTPPTDPVLPSKPECAGGKLVMLKTFPPRWSCVCPDGTSRQRAGKHSYACKGSPGGGSQSDPKKDCLKKGWKWTRKGCVDPDARCPKGYIGEPPNCRKPPRCPKGYIGSPPNCRKLPPPRCPKGYIGKPPKCTKVTFNKSPDPLKDVKKQFGNLKDLKKD